MKKRALSQAQLAALVWAGVLAPAAELLPDFDWEKVPCEDIRIPEGLFR